MREQYIEEAPLCEFLDIIVEEVNQLSRITSDLLDFARPMAADLRKLNLNDVVQRTLSFLGPYIADHKVTVTFTPSGKVPKILGDAKQIEQVMRNLVINAVQAMPDGGCLRVTTTCSTQKHVTVRFVDNGIGIKNELQQKVFEMFYRVSENSIGSGLGLYIVKETVDKLNGTIRIESQPGEGTRFMITMPNT